MKFDFTKETRETWDAARVPAGWYLTFCESYSLGREDDKHTWQFKIVAGSFAGSKIVAKLNNPDPYGGRGGEVAEKRLKGWVKRLGLVTDAAAGQEVEVNMSACVGQQFVIQMEDNVWRNDKGQEINTPQPGFLGCFAPSRPEIPVAERIKMGLPLLDGQSADPVGDGEGPKKGKVKGKGKGKPDDGTTNGLPAHFDPTDV